MPYIQAASRKELDGLIDELALRLVQDAKKDDSPRLRRFAQLHLHPPGSEGGAAAIRLPALLLIAMLTGIFKNISDEFYRRLGAPYEDKQKARSGDVDLFQEYLEEIEKI